MSNACHRLYVDHSRMGFKGDPIARIRVYLILLSVCRFSIGSSFFFFSLANIQNPRLLVDATFQKFAGSFFDLLCSSKDAPSFQPFLNHYFARYRIIVLCLAPPIAYSVRFDKEMFLCLLHQFHDYIGAAVLDGSETMIIHYDKGIKGATRMIDFMHKVNKTKVWCTEESFYNQILCDHLDLKIDFISWKATYVFYSLFYLFVGNRAMIYVLVTQDMESLSPNRITNSHSAIILGS
jgi:hypothetical protein